MNKIPHEGSDSSFERAINSVSFVNFEVATIHLMVCHGRNLGELSFIT
jgi:hypothetical protein